MGNGSERKVDEAAALHIYSCTDRATRFKICMLSLIELGYQERSTLFLVLRQSYHQRIASNIKTNRNATLRDAENVCCHATSIRELCDDAWLFCIALQSSRTCFENTRIAVMIQADFRSASECLQLILKGLRVKTRDGKNELFTQDRKNELSTWDPLGSILLQDQSI